MALIQWKCKLTMFGLTVHFNIEKIGKLQRFQKKFELTSDLLCLN